MYLSMDFLNWYYKTYKNILCILLFAVVSEELIDGKTVGKCFSNKSSC